ncbi:Alkaline protease 2 [Lasiodiplodia hormozganensis]|uniref:Alkaline protease 2 n=1 Tax=Lasiodiplodia hormozganensis TaxID=869390 RepID=A0AA39WVE2_9PEZI|nr:Alkaline protease 2 [Lasiodiplodia hormozganensis]
MKPSLFFLFTAALGALAAPISEQSSDQSGRKQYDIVMAPHVDIQGTLNRLHLNAVLERVFASFDNRFFKGFSTHMTPAEVTLLRTVSHMLAIGEVTDIHPAASRNDAPWGLQRISQKDTIRSNTYPLDRKFKYTWDDSSTLGKGVDAYVLDTGIVTTHQEFGKRATMGYSYWKDNMTDGHGHGTHCAGTIGGATVGVAKNANLIGVKVLPDDGPGPSTSLLAGLNWVARRHHDRSAQKDFVASVISLSLAFADRSKPVEAAIQKLVEGGVHAALAAGNDRLDACTHSPSAMGGAKSTIPVVTVGATTFDDRIAPFSDYGPCVDVFAPGVWIASAGIASNDEYTVKSGTSMATPHVAGLMAYRVTTGKDGRGMKPKEVKRWLVEGAARGVLREKADGSGKKPESQLIVAFNGVVGAARGGGGGLFG